MDLDALASALFNRRRAETQEVLSDATTRTYIGIATSDSHDGRVSVTFNGYETPAEDMGETQGYGTIEFPCGPNVKKGDSVVVIAVGGAILKAPMVVSSSGSGDRQQAEIDAAAEVANATAQHFWYDDNGAHVSTEAGEAEGTQNSLWNSLGMLFRKGANNLMALVTGMSPSVVIYDGTGNTAANVVASFASDLIELGKGSVNAVIEFCGGMARLRYDQLGMFLESLNVYTWLRLQEDGTTGMNYVTIGAHDGNSPGHMSFMQVEADSAGANVTIATEEIIADVTGVQGLMRPIGIYSVTMTTPPSDAADATVYFSTAAGGFTPDDTDYVVLLTPEGQPNGFTHIEYVVSAKYVNGFKIHSYNDWTSAITQTVVAVVMHK